jgi:hypothetical protein
MLDTDDIKIDVDYNNKVQNIIDSVAQDEKAAEGEEVVTNKLNIILGKIAKDTTPKMVEDVLNAAGLKYQSVDQITREKAEEILGISSKPESET